METYQTPQVGKQIGRKKPAFILCVLFTIAKALFYGWVFAYEIRKIMAAVAAGSAAQLQEGIVQLIAAAFFIALVNLVYTRVKTRITNRVIIEMEDDLIGFYNAHYSLGRDESRKLAALQNTVPNLATQSVEYVFGLISLICVLTVAVAYGMTISVPVVLLGIVSSGVLALLTNRLGKNVQETAKESEAATNDVYGKLWEYNDNLEVLPFLDERTAYAHLETAIERENALKVRAARLTNGSRIFMRFGNVGTILLGSVLGGILIYFHVITSADLMALIILLPTISDHLFQIPGKINDYNGMKGMCGVLSDFSGEEDRPITETGASLKERIRTIECKNFSIPLWGQDPTDIGSFTMKAGHVYGIYGPSGGGKTTFLKTLVKISHAYEGEILVNGTCELGALSHRGWWKGVLYLDQEDTIFPGSLAENICLSDPYDPERFDQAVHLALLDELLEERPELYERITADNLSSGERQQICLARLFYLKRELVLLDEVTSALSPQREEALLHNIVRWAKKEKCIVVMVSHSSRIREFCDDLLEIKGSRGGGTDE